MPLSLQGGKQSAAHVLDVFRGSKCAKVTAAGHHELPGYGAGKGLAKTDGERLLRKLVIAGVLEEETFRRGFVSAPLDSCYVRGCLG